MKKLFGRKLHRFELSEEERGSPELFGRKRDTQGPNGERIPFPDSPESAERLFSRRFNADINRDLILRRFLIGGKREALLVYMNGMADDTKINEFILRPLMLCEEPLLNMDGLTDSVIRIAEFSKETDVKKLMTGVMEGAAALFVDGEGEALLLETRGFEKRSISSPENEKVVAGPKESFTESLRTNITLLRRQLHAVDLVAELRESGDDCGTRLVLLYRDGFTNPALVAEVKRRLAGVSFSGVMSSGILAQMIEDSPGSPLPQILSTERPDRAGSHIMNGRVCVLVEGSPFALIMPVSLFSLLNSPEDVYLRRPLGTLLRLIRYAGALTSVLLPGYFLALALYHQGILSTEVLSTVVASRRMVFEPIGVEMLLLLLIFQLIREAGQRVPGNIGQAIGIIGGLIMGQAAVSAHLASSVVLIIVAVSGLGNFCVPDYQTQLAASYFRIAVVIAAWMAGLLGVTAVVLFAACHIAGLRSFGVPFLAPFAPRTVSKRPPVIRGRIKVGTAPDDETNTVYDKSLGERNR